MKSYGLEEKNYDEFIPNLTRRLQSLIRFMEQGAENGEKNFIDDIKAGHTLKYKRDIECLAKNEEIIVNKLKNK